MLVGDCPASLIKLQQCAIIGAEGRFDDERQGGRVQFRSPAAKSRKVLRHFLMNATRSSMMK